MQSGVAHNNLTVVGTIAGVLQDDGTWIPTSDGSGVAAVDMLYTDDTGAQFIYRDSGATPPVFSAYLIPAGTLYVVGANPRPYAIPNIHVTVSALPAGASTAAKQDALSAQIPAALGIALAADSLSVAPASDAVFSVVALAGEAHIGAVGGQKHHPHVTIARPANATPYAALDAISDSTSAPVVLTFAATARLAQGTGRVVKARLVTDQSTCTARFRLHLFNVAPTAINDNAPYAALFADAANRQGYIDFAACVTEGTGSDSAASLNATVDLPFACAAADAALYGLLETLDAFTPASAQNFYIELTAEND